MAREILLTSDGSQNFSTVLDGVTYEFNISYNIRIGVWTANISVDGIDLVNGVVLVGGVDIVTQFTFDLKNLYMVNVNNPNLDANAENLGTDVKLFKLSDDEVASIG